MASTSARNTVRYGREGKIVVLPVAASTTIYGGTIVCLNSSGFAISGTGAAGATVVGVARGTVVNSGLAGSVTVEVCIEEIYFFNNDSGVNAVTLANTGQNAYLVDNDTVSISPGTGFRSIAGEIVTVDGRGVAIKVSHPVFSGQNLVIPMPASADLSAAGNIGKFVTRNSSGKVAIAGANAKAIGVLVKGAVTDGICYVCVCGVTQVLCADTTANGGTVQSDASGQAVVSVTATGNVLATLLETGAAGQLKWALFMPSYNAT